MTCSDSKNIRVLLVQPSQKMILGKKKKFGSIMPPLGILQLAACIRAWCNVLDVTIFDYEAASDNEQPNFSNYDIIGISGTSVHMPHAYLLAKEIRRQNVNACIVFGGPHASFDSGKLLKKIPEIDVVIIGEGEYSLTELVNQYTTRDNIPSIRGCVTRNHNNFQFSQTVSDLNTLPELAYDVIDINNYQLSTHRNHLPSPFVSLITSRGCPYSCDYCQTPKMFGNKMRYRSPELVYNELGKLKALYGIKSVVFWDDTFTASRLRTLNMCDYLKKLDLKWMCNTRVECVDKELLLVMKEAGCEIIFFGIESFDIETLEDLNRTSREKHVTQALQMCKECGIRTVGSLMIGTPNDDLCRVDSNIERLAELSPDDVYISIFNAVVGSKTYDWATKTGIIGDIDWTNPSRFRGPPFGLPTVNNILTRYQLQRAQRTAYQHFYGKGNETQYE